MELPSSVFMDQRTIPPIPTEALCWGKSGWKIWFVVNVTLFT